MADEMEPGAMPEEQEPGGATPTGQQAGETPGEDVEALKAALRRANREAAERRKKLDELEQREREREEAQKSEAEKALAKAKSAEDKLRQAEERFRTATIRGAVVSEAARLNFYDPEDAVRLADLGEVEVSEDGKVAGVEAALKALAKAKPHLVKTATPGDINSQEKGRATAPSQGEIVQRKRASGVYTPI